VFSYGWQGSVEGGCSGPACATRWIRDLGLGGSGETINGDSGGPLFAKYISFSSVGDRDENRVCGVNSSKLISTDPLALRRLVYANVEGWPISQFLNSELVDRTTGRVWGDCSVYPGTPGVDGDGDGIRNDWGCDVCPTEYDPLQLDTDNDFVGDMCDNCPTVANALQLDSSAFGQKDADNKPSISRTRPPPPPLASPGKIAEWQAAYPGDACNPHPAAAIKAVIESAVSASPRKYLRENARFCTNGRTDLGSTIEPIVANNVFLSQDLVGGGDTKLGVTRYATCRCGNPDDRVCFSECSRGTISSLSGTSWVPATLEERDVKVTGQDSFGRSTGEVLAHYEPVPADQDRSPSAPPRPRPTPSNRLFGWRYWNDYKFSEPDPVDGVLVRPLVWSWVKNYGATRPSGSTISEPTQLKRRQDLYRFALVETKPNKSDVCSELYVGQLPKTTSRIPNLTECVRCGKVATFVKPFENVGLMAPKYFAPHVAPVDFSSVATARALEVLTDKTLSVVVAEDPGLGSDASVDRAAVYRNADHALIGTLFANTAGKLAFRKLLVEDPYVMTGTLARAAAMSSRRSEVAFFDARGDLDAKKLSIRRVSLRLGVSDRFTLEEVKAPFAGPVVAAAYSARDDAYFVMSRGGGKARLHRVNVALAADFVYEWSDPGTAEIDLSISEEGLLAVTSRRAGGFKVVVLDIGKTLSVSAISNISGGGALALAAR
jgi:hypothetical protein